MVGKRCAITSTLFDLKTETADVAASVKTNCSNDDLMDGMDKIIRQLASGESK